MRKARFATKSPGCEDGEGEWPCPEVVMLNDLNAAQKILSTPCCWKGRVIQNGGIALNTKKNKNEYWKAYAKI